MPTRRASKGQGCFENKEKMIFLSKEVVICPPMENWKKRLAVQTEDNILDYWGFEGKIPGEGYGAGKG